MSAPRSYIRDSGRCGTSPIFVPGEISQFYLNFDDPVNDSGFANFRLDLLDRFGAVVLTNVGSLTRDITTADFYNIIISIQWPVVANGFYMLRIYDTSAAIEKARTNMLTSENVNYSQNTALVSYRNRYDRDNTQYEKNPTYFTKLRLPLIEIDFQFEGESKQYRNQSNGRLRSFHKYEDEVAKIECYMFDKNMHRAAAAMFKHDTIFINNVFATVKGQYTRENNLFSAFSKASIDVIMDPAPGVSGGPLGGGGTPVPPGGQAGQTFLTTLAGVNITTVPAGDTIIVDF